MQWNRKFNYPTSTRALYNGKRLYDVNNEKYPSVTTILSATKPQSEIDSLNRLRLGTDSPFFNGGVLEPQDNSNPVQQHLYWRL